MSRLATARRCASSPTTSVCPMNGCRSTSHAGTVVQKIFWRGLPKAKCLRSSFPTDDASPSRTGFCGSSRAALACYPTTYGSRLKSTSGFSGSSTVTSRTLPFAARTCFIRGSRGRPARHGGWNAARKRSITWRASSLDVIGLREATSPSRILRSSPTRMSRTRAALTFRQGRICGLGLPGAEMPSLRRSSRLRSVSALISAPKRRERPLNHSQVSITITAASEPHVLS